MSRQNGWREKWELRYDGHDARAGVQAGKHRRTRQKHRRTINRRLRHLTDDWVVMPPPEWAPLPALPAAERLARKQRHHLRPLEELVPREIAEALRRGLAPDAEEPADREAIARPAGVIRGGAAL
jgi:hypothetical protein